MFGPGLADPDFKLRRAKVHLDSLKQEVDTFVESKPYVIETYDDLEAAKYVIKFRFTPAMIWPIGAILGDFISCLRSSLDHLVFGLITRLHQPTSKYTGFPIIGIFEESTLPTINRATKGLPSEAVAIVKLLQPYNSGASYKLTHLWRLNKLWNIDKHRHIPLHSGAAQMRFPSMPLVNPEIDIVDDCSIVRFPLAVKDQLKFEPPRIEMTFGVESEGIVIRVGDLYDMYEFVGESVIPRFKRFFPEDRPAH